MAKRRSRIKITQHESSRAQARQGRVAKSSQGKFQPLRIADIPKEEIERANDAASQGSPDSYPENAPAAADNPDAAVTPQSDRTAPQGGGEPGPGGGGQTPQPEEGQPQAGGPGGPTGGAQAPQAGGPGGQGGAGNAGDKEKPQEEKPEAEEKPDEEKRDEEDKEGEEGEGDEGKEEAQSEDKGKDKQKDKKKDEKKKEEEEKGAKALAQAAGRAIMSALSSLATTIGWPVMIGCAVIALIILIILGVVASYWAKTGPTGRTSPITAGVDDPNVKKLDELMNEEVDLKTTAGFFGSGITKGKRLEIAEEEDREFIKSGKIDKRLAAALVYLAERHDHIRVSHIVSGYNAIKTNTESGRFHDIKYPNNISAHKNGQAADIDEIDYVKEKCNCGTLIPVQVKWQTIGDDPFAESPPDVLNQIKKPEDFANTAIQKALEKFGIKGLDQKDLVEKMKASKELAAIDSPYDLTDPNVIAAFEKIGVTGIGDEKLQSGLKKAQAIQTLSEMDLGDIDALNDPKVQDLMAQAGVPVSDELIDNLGKYKATQVVQTIKSIEDLNNPEVQKALGILGVDTNDPKFKESIAKMEAASIISNWQGDPNDPKLKAALATFGIQPGADMEEALKIMQTSKATFEGIYGIVNSDVSTVQKLEQLGIYTDNPEMQKAIQQYRAAEQIVNGNVNWADPEFLNTLEGLGLDSSAETQEAMKKYQAAQFVSNYQGDYTDPQFQNALSQLGVNYGADEQEAINKYKAAQTISKAANGELAYDSQEVKDALKTIGAGSMEDAKAKAAAEIGAAKDPNDPKLASAREKIGLAKQTYTDTMSKLGAAKNLTNINEFSDLNNPEIQKDLEKLGLKDPKYYESLQKIGALGGLTQIHDLDDLNNPAVKNSLKELGIDNPALYEGIGKLGSLQTIANINDLEDLNSRQVKDALNNLGVKNPAVYNNLAKLGSIDALLSIKSPFDLAKPQVIDALGNLGIDVSGLQGPLTQAGSIMALTQIKSPADLLKPQSLMALDTLGVINLDAQMLGQIGAIQTLMQVDSVGDLLNPNSILALNTLGLISLSNPVTMALMAISFIDNLLGGDLLGGLLGGLGGKCKETTDCYKPTAQENIYKVTEELLQMPYDLGDKNLYRVTQLIVWKLDYIQQKDPSLQSKLDALYWTPRAKNVGLFAMPEAYGNIHIGY